MKSLKPFVNALGKESVNISVITNTGFEEAKKLKRLFSKMFPEWYKDFQSDQKVIENMKDRLRDVCINHPEYLLK